ncbi:hypothetical protein GCM10010439_60410 [Actinocorallia aurantiaca]|uniref:HTH merR-type domain-containing protein n=2 Tax=Actinocorallia aurantiaca TaxID=46204 RepID=A0ABN3UMV4_9ACTN
MSIGVFARRVGLAPSALRFYGDCGLLRPARVDEVTGYRYYAPEQEDRAVLVRRLRDAGMPLPEASVVLDGSKEEARAVLERHARRTRESAKAARTVIEELLRGLAHGRDTAVARIGGAELAGAVRQVAAAVAGGETREEFPVLGCVLLEVGGQEVRLVATDRYRLSVRTLRARSASGGTLRTPVPVEEMHRAASWALPLDELEIETDGRDVWLLDTSERPDPPGPPGSPALSGSPAPHGACGSRGVRGPDGVSEQRDGSGWLDGSAGIGGLGPGDASGRYGAASGPCGGSGRWKLRTAEGTFPSYQMILDGLPPVRHRVIVARAALVAVLGEQGAQGPFPLSTGGGGLAVGGPGPAGTELPAVCTGPPLRIAFDPAVLLPALEASVGPDVLLEVSSPDAPVVVRSADQGSFTTLVMPVLSPSA